MMVYKTNLISTIVDGIQILTPWNLVYKTNLISTIVDADIKLAFELGL